MCGCAGYGSMDHGDGMPLPVITFQHVPEIFVNAGSVEVVDKAYAGRDNLNPLSEKLRGLVERFTENRIVSSGSFGKLLVIVEDASVFRSDIDESESVVEKVLWLKKRERYDFYLKVRISFLDDRSREFKGTVLVFGRRLEIPESFSMAERERSQLETLEKIADDFSVSVSDYLQR